MKKSPPSPARPLKGRAQSITIRLQISKVQGLDALADRKGTNRSALIQLAVAEYLERESSPPVTAR